MELQHLLAARQLVETVDVLGDDSPQLARTLQLRQLPVGGVGLRTGDQQLFPIEVEKFLRVVFVEGVAQHDLRGIGELLVVEAVHAAEVGDARLSAHAGASEKYDVVALVDPLLQLFQLFHSAPPSLRGQSYCYPTAFFRKRQAPPPTGVLTDFTKFNSRF